MMITWTFLLLHCTPSDDNCTNHFTPNQVARMHCYLDLVYQNWLTELQPAPIPLAPIVTDQSPDSVSIYWLPPIRGPLYQGYACMVFFIYLRYIVQMFGFFRYGKDRWTDKVFIVRYVTIWLMQCRINEGLHLPWVKTMPAMCCLYTRSSRRVIDNLHASSVPPWIHCFSEPHTPGRAWVCWDKRCIRWLLVNKFKVLPQMDYKTDLHEIISCCVHSKN